MQITHIRIAGFKSFVDPTEFPVEEGLTGIVGPNGCGKSNLLEALRWAMGASSAKAMRGEEMDDLIFSGSADRPARETAEVTLVLDNADRRAPAEFNASDTLEVVRLLKRGVGSTYKLNGRTVRGKDIQLLFADASTGANSPALVRQGQISELIAAKPQNRRRILEEAAGIAGLNTRRHEAELKLRGAETNLERLTEITAEVERQLDSLKRQARKARKYKELSELIQGHDALAAHLRWLAAKEARKTAQAAMSEARAAVETLTRADAQAETARLKISGEIAPLREAETLAGTKLGQARIALARLEAEQKAAGETLARLAEDDARLQEDIARETEMIREAQVRAAEAQAEFDALPHEDASASEAEEDAARKALEAAREALRMAEGEVDRLSSDLFERRARRRAAQDARDAQTRAKASLEAQVETLAADLAAIGDLTALAATLREAESAESTAERANEAALAATETAETALEDASRTASELGAPVRELETRLRALDGEIGGLERLLRRVGPETAMPVLAQVKVQDGYEKAVAAALGDDLLASTERSDPVHWQGASVPSSALPQGSAPLSAHVEAPAELSARLAQCGVVTEADGAKLAASLLPGQRLVSTAGHLWRWDGFARTPAAPLPAAERLEQQARLAAAREERPVLAAQLETASAALPDAEAARAECDAVFRRARAAVPEAAKALDLARRASADIRKRTEHASLRRDTVSEALARVRADLRAASDVLALADAHATSGEESGLAIALESARETLVAAREAEINARGHLTDCTRGREQALARREGLARDVSQWTMRAASASRRCDALLARHGEVLARIDAARREAAAGPSERLKQLAEEAGRLETARNAAADRLAEAEIRLREADAAARQATSDASRARESLAAASVSIEMAEARFADCAETARTQFQRLPEGLLPLALSRLGDIPADDLGAAGAGLRADELRRERDMLGGVNMEAEAEADELAARLGLQAGERQDLEKAIARLREGVHALNDEGRARLVEAFETVNEHFKALFTALFRGGQAELRLIDADDPLAAGLEIFAQPPGKRLGTLQLMSGGEQALTAAALIFAVFLSNPAPVCVLDEVDAPLDDANVDRFCNMLNEMRTRTDTRFIIITHNPVTMSRMDRLFGVTMREKGVSKLVSVDLNAAEDLVAAE